MLWNLIVEAKSGEDLTGSITVEASNWYSALRAGLERHNIDGAVLSTLSCRIQGDNSVVASDVVSKRVFLLKPAEAAAAVDAAPVDDREDEPADATAGEAEDADAAALVPHEVFFVRDDPSEDGSGVFYRERAVAVKPGTSKSAAAHLAQHYFEVLKQRDEDDGSKLFISIHVFDHVFSRRSERPAVAALTWREWQGKKPKILYPLSGDEGMTFSMLPAPYEPFLLVPRGEAPQKAVAEPLSEPPDTAEDLDLSEIGERMLTAFERMQDIYGIHSHDEAAAFALSLARDLIPSGGGSCMLFSPLEYTLYVSAAEGDKAALYQCETVSSSTGIIGFALKNSAVVNVSDPSGDGRFDDIFDGRKGFSPRNVLLAPMQFEGQVIGVLELIDSPNEDGFTEEDANIISYFGTSFAEYAAVSLPSRYPEFSDRDFLLEAPDSPPPVQASKKKPAQKKVEAAVKKGKERARKSPKRKR